MGIPGNSALRMSPMTRAALAGHPDRPPAPAVFSWENVVDLP